MDKLLMCRICLVENVTMYTIVANSNINKLYETLTHIPFVTEDRRPNLACFFCYARLKQCCQLLRQCLIAEELFAQLLNKDYKPNPLINTDDLKVFGGFVKSIQTEIIAMEEAPFVSDRIDRIIIEPDEEHQSDVKLETEAETRELIAVNEGPNDFIIIQPMEEHQSHEVDPENEEADMASEHSDLNSKEDLHIIEFKTDVEEHELPDVFEGLNDKIQPMAEHQNEDKPITTAGADVNPQPSTNAVDKSQQPTNAVVSLPVPTPPLQAGASPAALDMNELLEILGEDTSRTKTSDKPIKTTGAEVNPQPSTSITQPQQSTSVVMQLPVPTPLLHTEASPGALGVDELLEILGEEHSRTKTYDKPIATAGADVNPQPSTNTTQPQPSTRSAPLPVLTPLLPTEASPGALGVDELLEILGEEPSRTKTYGATIAEKPERDSRRTKPEDAITAKQTKKEKSSKVILKNHTQIGENPNYKCDICQSSFSGKINLSKHIGAHTEEKPYKGDVFQRTFSSKCTLTKHIRADTGEKPYKGDVNQRSFSDKSTLTKRIRAHTGEKPYKCDVCQRNFSDKTTLTKHIRAHTKEKPFKCDICQGSFCNKNTLTKHIRAHYREKSYKCDVCQRSFRSKSNLTTHVRVHSDEKPFKCDICQFSFRLNAHLTNHNRIHTGEKSYKCNVCQRSFRTKSTLTTHIRVHTDEKPFNCSICQLSFRLNAHLTKHIRTHTGEKPYKCDACKRKFSQSSSLKRHRLTHTGEKPYKCDVCSRSFRHLSNFKRHNRMHKGEKPFKCNVCHRSFRQSRSLKRHKFKHSREKCVVLLERLL